MAAANGHEGFKTNVENYLEPLPSLKAAPSVERLDAGLRSLDHYRSRLPYWRYASRQRLIPLVRWETPYLASIQKLVRTPALDTYFSLTANLGTHVFFMIFLPMLFWCGQTSIGRAMVTILAAGVFLSGVLKDMWCLPRPLSPPLHRISMSHSTVLEYGFPSTHSTNAVSVAVYVLFLLSAHKDTFDPSVRMTLQIVTSLYATSIVLGRLYCGMHGFCDVIIGSILGALVAALQFRYGDAVDAFVYSGSFKVPLSGVLVVIMLIRLHPEPADDCPCFDDSVAFAGVVIGMLVGSWHYAQTGWAWKEPSLATVPFDYTTLGFPRVFARILLGTCLIVTWREAMKPTLLLTLPPVFRIIEKLGLSHARRFFLQASDYKKVPGHLKDNDVIPSVTHLPSFLTSLRHPRRNRSISIGPQSAADAYETLAYRQRKRRESKSDQPQSIDKADYMTLVYASTAPGETSRTFVIPHKIPSVEPYDPMVLSETAIYTPNERGNYSNQSTTSRQSSQKRRQDEKEEREIFSRLEKPRVRYDVEVVTKLIVYAGIGGIAMEGCPLLFEVIGLGIGDLHPR